MIKAGDIVRVTDWGKAFSTNRTWFAENAKELKIEWIICYAYGNSSNYFEYSDHEDLNRYKVLYVQDGRALITIDFFWTSEVYLIGLDGIELYEKPTEMTIAEIEEKLGVKNLKIVKEKENE